MTLRKLVDKARREGEAHDRVRRSQGAAHSFMSAIAGNEPHYEEALRALFRGDKERFIALVSEWPIDVREYVHALAAGAFQESPEPPAV